MTTVVADISVSLDGFVTGPDAGPDNGLGTGGLPLHAWVLDSDDPVDAEILARSTERSGAVVMGRNLFDVIDAPSGWSDEMGYGAQHAVRPPFFVVTHQPPAEVRLKLDFRFVPDVPTAIEQAKAVAGDKDVFVMGGGEIIRQSVDAGLVDELVLHLSPVILGAGTPLFVDAARRELVQREVRPSRTAVHVTYDVRQARRTPSGPISRIGTARADTSMPIGARPGGLSGVVRCERSVPGPAIDGPRRRR